MEENYFDQNIISFQNAYGWRGALVLSSGILLQVCVFSTLFTLPSHCKEQSNQTEKKTFIKVVGEKFSISSHIFKCWHFMLFYLSTFLQLVSLGIVFTHLVAYAESEGISSTWSGFIVTIIALTSLGKMGL